MNTASIAGLLPGICALFASALLAADAEKTNMSFLENEEIKFGVDLSIGGSGTWLSLKNGPNMINSHDWGRQIQMSFYSGPKPYEPDGKKPKESWANLGWNPIQSGDCYGHRSQVLDHRNDGKEIYVKCRPMHWPLKNEPGHCLFECWYRIDGHVVHVTSRLSNERRDQTPYPAHTQELPAVYTNGIWYKLVSYQGDRPFSGAQPTVLVDKKDGKGWPWRNFYTPEHWVALLDEKDRGLGLYHPGVCGFTGGFAGQPKGSGGPKETQTGYMGATIPEILDHHIEYTYTYALIVGSLDDIRKYVYDREKDRALPHWAFKADRQHWTYQNITDAGWPIKDGLKFQLGPGGAVLSSPKTFWRAEEAPIISVQAAFKTDADKAQILLQPYDALDAGDWAQWGPEKEKRPKPAEAIAVPFTITGDGQVHTVEIDLSKNEHYRGGMTQVRLRLPGGTGTATLHGVSFKK